MYANTLKFLFILISVVLGTTIAWYINGKSLIGIDDANIYMVYMRNFAEGHGFVFNIGGERVEGFTSVLWTLIGALAFLVSPKPEVVLILLNIALVSYSLWKLVRYIDMHFGNGFVLTPVTLLFLGVLLVVPGYYEWTVLALMETGLWSALLILITLNLLKDREEESSYSSIEFLVLIALMVLCRPESLLWVPAFIFAKFLKLYLVEKQFLNAVKHSIPAVIVFIITVVGLVSWRLYYFGFPLPNTYYAKVSADLLGNLISGIEYNFKGFLYNPVILLSLLIVVCNLYQVLKLRENFEKYKLLLTGGVVIVTLMVPLYTGGDHFPLSRFLQPTLPIMLLALFFNFKLLNFKPGYIFAFAFIVFFALINRKPLMEMVAEQKSPNHYGYYLSVWGRERSERLNEFFADHSRLPSQGVRAAGSAFAYKGKTIDLLGLNNVDMAHATRIKNPNVLKNHASFNKGVFYEQKPDILWVGSRFIEGDEDVAPVFMIDARYVMLHIHEEEQFQQLYSAVVLRNNKLDYAFKTVALKEFLNSLDKSVYSYEELEYE